MIEIQVKVGGRSNVTVSSDKIKDVFQELSFFNTLPRVCPRCKKETGEDVCYRLLHNKDKQNHHYYKLKCDKGHQSNLGQYAEGDALFYKNDEEWRTYEEIKKAKEGGSPAQSQPSQPSYNDNRPPDDDFPL